MNKLLNIVMLLLVVSIFANAQKYTISGYIRDKDNGEDLVGASVYLEEIKKGTTTNHYGFYSLTVDKGEYTFIVSFLGFDTYSEKINLLQNEKRTITLTSTAIMTDEVEIKGERSDANIKDIRMSTVTLPSKKIKEIPAFMGEPDVLKTIQLLPGVQSANEGSSGFYVRGGGPDQNLVLLDEALVYNASHLFGFFSVFNADAVKDISLTKGGMPANYGGRLSSVLDITMKEGNNQHFESSGSIGLIASHLTLQGPIQKNKSSYLVTARRTYADFLAGPFLPLFERSKDFAGTGYYFYDINAKLNYRFSEKDRIFLSGYYGKDVFKYDSKEDDFVTSIPWGNATASIRWNHLFNEKLFLNTTAIFSNYDFEMVMEQQDFEFGMYSAIQDYTGKMDFTYIPTINHKIKFGLDYIYHKFEPSSVSGRIGETKYTSEGVTEQYANEGAVYIHDDFDLTENLSFGIGLRGSAFQMIGPFERYVKSQFSQTSDTIFYGQWEEVALYKNLEPRFSTRFIINDESSVKAAYTWNYQYVHLASLSAGTMPTDMWIPSSEIVKPQFGKQITAGYFRNFKDNMYETSVEVYYRKMENLIEYMDGYTPADNIGDNSDNYFTFGEGYSYGIELFFKKRLGDITGWIGYTWSKTDRIFEELNNGEPFPAKYDRRHDLSFIANYKYNKYWQFSMVFVYATGNALTIANGRYLIDGRIVNQYGDRNSYRMKDYHRLDLSATYENNEKNESRKVKRSYNFSVYNVYNRKNPYFIYYDNEGDLQSGTLQTKVKQVSLFPILPSITVMFEF
jgi:hypothetical protein